MTRRVAVPDGDVEFESPPAPGLHRKSIFMDEHHCTNCCPKKPKEPEKPGPTPFAAYAFAGIFLVAVVGLWLAVVLLFAGLLP